MSHSYTNLQALVDTHNADALAALVGSANWLFSPTPPVLKGARVTSLLDKEAIPGEPIKCIGTLHGKKRNLWDFLKNSLANAPTLATEAVFTVIDSRSVDRVEVLPVVLCVGINYGQFKTPSGSVSHSSQSILSSLSPMRGWMNSAFGPAGQAYPGDYHLVVANFFPWITNLNWGSTAKNRASEAVLMRTCGYSDPVAVIGDLVNRIDPEYLVFHGVDNCAAALGLQVVQRVSYKNTIILCDNLGMPVTSNSIVLP